MIKCTFWQQQLRELIKRRREIKREVRFTQGWDMKVFWIEFLPIWALCSSWLWFLLVRNWFVKVRMRKRSVRERRLLIIHSDSNYSFRHSYLMLRFCCPTVFSRFQHFKNICSGSAYKRQTIPKSVTTSAPAMSSSEGNLFSPNFWEMYYMAFSIGSFTLKLRTVRSNFMKKHVIWNIPLESELSQTRAIHWNTKLKQAW